MSKDDALKEVAAQLRKAGATLPAPEATGTIEGAMLTGLCIALAIVEDAISKQLDDPMQRKLTHFEDKAQQQPDEFLLRGLLASELKCWHRLTAEEAQNLVDFVRNMPAKPAQQGWKLVPVEPTAEMRNAYHAVTDDDVTMKGAAGSRWFAMLNAAPQPAQQQEPFCWMLSDAGVHLEAGRIVKVSRNKEEPDDLPLYTSPPASKPWVGLTNDERLNAERSADQQYVETRGQELRPSWASLFLRAIEAMLQEKNAQPSKPLTDEEITKIWETRPYFNDFARAIEAAHGIKENT